MKISLGVSFLSLFCAAVKLIPARAHRDFARFIGSADSTVCQLSDLKYSICATSKQTRFRNQVVVQAKSGLFQGVLAVEIPYF